MTTTRTALAAFMAVTLGITVSACQVNERERPELNEYETVSPEPVPTISAPAGVPALNLVDVSPGGPQEGDPLFLKLNEATSGPAGGQEIYLDVFVYYDAELPDSEQVSLTPDTPNSVTVTVAQDVVDPELAPFYRVTGTFTAEAVGDSAFVLTTVNTESFDELIPDGPTTAQRCTANDAGDRIGSAFEELASDPQKRADMRKQWLSSPEVWWAIQRTAMELNNTNGETEGDFVTQACAAYLG